MADPDHFAALVADTHQTVRAYIASLGVPTCDVDDIAQEAYLEFYRQPERLPAGVSPTAWIKGIARNRALHLFRAQSRRGVPLAELAELLRGDDDTSQRDDAAQELGALHTCLDQLPERQRRLIDMSYREGLSGDAMAAAAGMSANAVRVALFRLREALSQCIRRRLDGATTP